MTGKSELNGGSAGKYFKLARAIFFCLVIALPQATALMGWRPAVKQDEKRQLASFPALAWDAGSWISFPENFDSFFLDRFNMRSWLIRVHGLLKYYAFKVSLVEHVTIGQNGWLFYSSSHDGDPIACYRATNLFSDARLAQMVRDLENWKKWFGKQGIAFFIIIAPDKHTVYSEYLPRWMKRAVPKTRLEQFMESLPPDVAEIIAYPGDALLESKKRFPTYYKTDTHWNQWGAFVATQSLMDIIFRAAPNLDPLRENDYELRAEYRAGGDLATMLGFADRFDDSDIKIIPKTGASPKDPSGGRRPTALVFGDSFHNGMIQFIEKDLNVVKHVHSKVMNKDLILQQRPDMVIQELVERYLDNLGAGAPEAE